MSPAFAKLPDIDCPLQLDKTTRSSSASQPNASCPDAVLARGRRPCFLSRPSNILRKDIVSQDATRKAIAFSLHFDSGWNGNAEIRVLTHRTLASAIDPLWDSME